MELPEHTPLLQRPGRHHTLPSSFSALEEQEEQQHQQQRQSKYIGKQIWKFALIAICSSSAVAVFVAFFRQNSWSFQLLSPTLQEQAELNQENHYDESSTAKCASSRRHSSHDVVYDRWESWKDENLGKLLQRKEPVIRSATFSLPFSMTQKDRDKASVMSEWGYDDDVWINIIKDGSATNAGGGAGGGAGADSTKEEDDDSLSAQLREFGQKVKSWWQPTASNIKTKVQTLKENCAPWLDEAVSDQERTIQSKMQEMEEDFATWWNENYNDEAISEKEHAIKSKVQVLEENFDAWWNEASVKQRQWWDNAVASFRNFVSSDEANDDHNNERWWELTRQSALVMERSSTAGSSTEVADEEWWEASQDWFSRHVVTTAASHNKQKQRRREAAERNLLYFNTTQAFRMLGWYDHSTHFFNYQQGWETQINQAYCGVASAVAVLNSFKGSLQSYLPIDSLYDPYPFATQFSLVRNDCVYQNVIHVDDTFDGILSFPGGLCLEQTRRLLECHLPTSSWNVSAVNVNPQVSMEHVTRDMIRALHDPKSRVVVNVHRELLGQKGGGHFSVLAAYNSRERMFLFMDVAKYKYPPVWVPAEKLYAAMQTVDRCGNYEFPTTKSQEANLVNVTQAYLANASNEELAELLDLALQTLGCRPQYRGYIIVQQM